MASEMLIEQVDINEVKPYALNNRNHDKFQIERIAKSIKEFGFNQPIVIDENNEIIVGHARLEAAKLLWLKRVPVYKKKGLSAKQKKAYRILDNKLQNDSTWNFENLQTELESLLADGFDLDGFDLSRFLGKEISDPSLEYSDMPEFISEDQTGFKTLLVHFRTKGDMEEFAGLLDQKITEKTKSIWYPEKEIEHVKNISVRDSNAGK